MRKTLKEIKSLPLSIIFNNPYNNDVIWEGKSNSSLDNDYFEIYMAHSKDKIVFRYKSCKPILIPKHQIRGIIK